MAGRKVGSAGKAVCPSGRGKEKGTVKTWTRTFWAVPRLEAWRGKGTSGHAQKPQCGTMGRKRDLTAGHEVSGRVKAPGQLNG